MTDFVGEDKQKLMKSLKSIYNFNTFKLTSISTVSDNELIIIRRWLGNNAMWESEPFNWDPATTRQLGFSWYYNVSEKILLKN